MARRELKLSSRDQGKLVERNPLYPEGDRALLLQTLPSLSSEGFSRWSLECPWSLPAPSWSHFRQCCGSWAAPQTSPCPSGEWVRRCWLLASRCLLPWLGRDSSHPRFLPQRARGTDPVLVLEGRGGHRCFLSGDSGPEEKTKIERQPNNRPIERPAELPASCQVAKDPGKGTRLPSAPQQSVYSAIKKGG
ncbi:uncharacterized protein LOC121101891 isoform X2 [Ursus maritimus]|uniref:Uncharacterized protein LOC121101891 isoform X2 n=1 Tax=Ursus maritimus TaxID=29073 RepID=A0A8M1FGD8_URSMA|nr:uncharacterized protein LOC121101891 isoform X2 [Ursus maritimus]